MNFSDYDYKQKKRQTRKDIFLSRMNALVPWELFASVVEPYYPQAGRGRKPYALLTMLRIHCLQQWYTLSDEGMEDALYETVPFRQFAGLSLDEAIPDRTTIMNFRHLLERHQLGREIFSQLNQRLVKEGFTLQEGTLMDATLISAPSSTKNRKKQRDPEMHSTKKGNQWHFGMKSHIGVDAGDGLVQRFSSTPANEHDLNQAEHLLHGEEVFVFADSGYLGASERPELKDKEVDWFISQRPSQWRNKEQEESQRMIERSKARMRAPVEHLFRIIKCQFGFRKTYYKGLAKNDNKLAMLYALANLVKVEQKIRREAFL